MDGILSYIIDALYSLPGILVGLSFHEWGHAYAAYKRGDRLDRLFHDDRGGLRLGQARTREHAQL